MEWTNKNNTIITKIQHPNSVQIDALIFAKFSLSLAYQWCFFRLYILISFHFFSSTTWASVRFFLLSTFVVFFIFLNFKFISHFQDYIILILSLSLLSNDRFSLDIFSMSLIVHFDISMNNAVYSYCSRTKLLIVLNIWLLHIETEKNYWQKKLQ